MKKLVFLIPSLLLFVACDEQDTDVKVPTEAVTLTVAVEGVEQALSLATLTAQEGPSGVAEVNLLAVLSAAAPDANLADFVCDFVAEDGFRTSDKGVGCEPLPCQQSENAWVEVNTGDLRWLPELGMRGCYGPKALRRVELSPAPPPVEGIVITVAVADTDHPVSLLDLEPSLGPDDLMEVGLDAVLLQAEPAGALADYLCDFVSADGFRTSSKGEGCEPISCARTANARLDVATGDMRWLEEEADLRGCYRLSALRRVELILP